MSSMHPTDNPTESSIKGINMEASFWHQKWERGEIQFHEIDGNQFLKRYIDELDLPRGSRIFLPLCGKTCDIAWLLARGYRVVGAELSKHAISELFKELDMEPEVSNQGKLTRYSAKNIDIFVGDIFDVSADDLWPVSAIFDRAALVALPASLREHYASHLINITDAAPQLLVSYEYDQGQTDGPPFSVNADEVRRHYGSTYKVTALESKDVEGGLKGKVASTETVWLLQMV
jgi:thiopurine S-methyltransferase